MFLRSLFFLTLESLTPAVADRRTVRRWLAADPHGLAHGGWSYAYGTLLAIAADAGVEL